MIDSHDLWNRVKKTLDGALGSGTQPDANRLGWLVADDLEAIGVYVDRDQVADYITAIPGWDGLVAHGLADALAEAIEEDLDEEDE